MILKPLQHAPPLAPDFVPAALWNRSYLEYVARTEGARDLGIRVGRPDGASWVYRTRVLPTHADYDPINLRYAERLLKTLLWAWGGSRVEIGGAPELADALRLCYSKEGARAFDADFMGPTCFGEALQIDALDDLPTPSADGGAGSVNRDLSGCRIGFDLGGSDRKCAALIDGEVVFSEEIGWDPYFESDPAYHLEGIRDSLRRAAAHLPRVDAIGGSAAGIYVNNEPRVASLFRGVTPEDLVAKVRPMFRQLQAEWGGVPFVVANDGDVSALAGSFSLEENAVLGVSMGTSQAAGCTDAAGNITGWLNELAFAPVDYRTEAPEDEWSKDRGCGVQYFSQQAVARLIPASGLPVPEELSPPEKLEVVQARMEAGDASAAAIYETIGCYLGYSIAHYADFYDFGHLLLLGRVTTGLGGLRIEATAQAVLADAFPELGERITLSMPDETMKRHGQAIAAASLPTLQLS